MRITILPNRKQLELAGRRRAGDVLRELGFLPGTAMVIRGNELILEGEMLESDDEVEVRSVISGGSGGNPCRPSPVTRRRPEGA